MSLLRSLFLHDTDRMSDKSFRMMQKFMAFMDRFQKPYRVLDQFGIIAGMNVVDYGCGPARYVKRASELVGKDGRVFAADVHELAIEAVRENSARHNLENVRPVLIRDYVSSIADGVADVIYALDMFHMVKEPTRLLGDLNRIARPTGVLFIDDGHQPRKKTKRAIEAAGTWRIVEEKRRHLKCTPVKV
jgi:ubiquinone/menaquinone biosynthesis C-methylase UbiE